MQGRNPMKLKQLKYIVIVLLISCFNKKRIIRIKGSDTEVNLSVVFAEKFHEINPTVFVSISGGGSGLGIASLINGTADIANSSRRIKQKELELFTTKGIKIDSFIFAQDAIAFVVKDNLPIDTITINQLQNILSGKINNWKTICNVDLAINIYGRQSNSGTHEFIKKKINIEFSNHSKEMNGNAQILEAIKVDHSGIGYVGAGYVSKGKMNGIKVLFVKSNLYHAAVSPFEKEKVEKGFYFFYRPLYQYFKTNSYNEIKPFLDFEKTEIGRTVIREAGYYNSPE